ncbi:uncharacterized protein LOC132932844 [Metopolophium dirhodum]|uniref:uncharacterized protein LOC132932844 n=1 Tax=Metopolophium dirhodum TaxID=44670 RepID=UPI00298F46AA|nr:uncharacterized protein LOC132932844 [Metopolophium dirhodum]
MAPTDQQDKKRVERSLQRAIVKRDKHVNQMLILFNLSKTVESDPSIKPMFDARKRDLETLMSDFRLDQEDVMDQMVELGRIEEFIREHSVIETVVTDQYYSIQAVAGAVAGCKLDTVIRSGSHINLPKIELPHFNGDIINWRSYRDTFTSLVHENSDLNSVERFHYLISSVSGAASTVVRSVPLTGPNYVVAWNALHDRFDSTRLILHAHLDKLFGFSPIKNESLHDLNNFLDVFKENTAAINALGVHDLSGFLLFYIASRVLDSSTKRLFEADRGTHDLPTLNDLLILIQSRCKILQNSSMSDAERKPAAFTRRKPVISRSSLLASTKDHDSHCYACQGTHYIYKCEKFKGLTTSARFQLVKSNNMCSNCLSGSHAVSTCPSKYSCRTCSGKHHSLLHFESRKRQAGTNSINNAPAVPSSSVAPVGNLPSTDDTSFVGTVCSGNLSVLGTAVIRMYNQQGQWVPVRALIDCGSQISAITTKCATRLGLTRCNRKINVVGLSQSPVVQAKGVVLCSIVPHMWLDRQLTCEPVLLSKITGLMPLKVLDLSIRTQYMDLELADPNFDRPGQIEFLLGADVYNHIFTDGYHVRHTPGLPSAFETTLGWIIVGAAAASSTLSSQVSLSLTTEPSLKQLLNRFWEVEEPVVLPNPFTEEQKCEEIFRRTTTRDPFGRYSVSFPFKTNPSVLGDSRSMALSRFYNLERKLTADPIIYEEYKSFMNEYLQLGHMKLAQTPGNYIIPHHAVVKRTNGKIKLRVVFDASATTSSGTSLNNLLFTGPKLQCDIADLLLRCRFHVYMLTADICKMYRQIQVSPAECSYQHILWRNDPSESIQEYALSTVTYGVSSSPFQAIRVLHQLELDEGSKYPAVQGVLSSQTYVDDIIAGATSVEQMVTLQKQLIGLLGQGQFELKKWASNCRQALQNIPKDDQVVELSFDPKDDCSIKILGLHWDPANDIFSYHSDPCVSRPTNRSVLSAIAKIYDPLGALSPITFWAKCFMQILWKNAYEWDQPIPDELASSWNSFSTQLPSVSQVKIRRHIPIEQCTDVQLLGFSDASQKGYSAVVYMRLSYASKPGTVHLLTVRSKVAPLKNSRLDESLSIPRLELCGALLLAQTLHRVQKALSSITHISSIHAWTDSTVVLSWLTTQQVTFKVFVTNRLNKIGELLPSVQWRYVPSMQNPADCVSRGLLPTDALEHSLYWDGPSFVQQSPDTWKSPQYEKIPVAELPEQKTVAETLHVMVTPTTNDDWIEKFSSLTRLKRVVAYMRRFIVKAHHKSLQRKPTHQCDEHPPMCTGFLRYEELRDALQTLVQITQRIHFPQLLKLISSSSSSIKPRSIACLTPFIDTSGIIRVGGRLRRSTAPEDFKYPVLIPKSSALTLLLIQYYHITGMHAGPQLVASLLSSQFWIVSGRSVIRHIIFKCVTCTRHRASTVKTLMGDLPSSRVCPSRPFSNVGVDYAGPLLIKEGKRRNARSTKCYVAIFICMAVKAVHIEVVSDLTTSAFLAALKRFIARRGIPLEIYSDCGTNFQGAASELRRLWSDPEAQNSVSNAVQCRWHFNPPAAPHFGGLWEAAVKSMKTHLKRVIGTQLLTFEEMCTITRRIEAILNSRPITPLSSDPNDLRVLTPGHFLTGEPLVTLPDHDVTQIPMNHLNRWQLLDQFHQSLWKRWSSEYLRSLQVRSK